MNWTVTITYADNSTKVVSGTVLATDTNAISETVESIQRQIDAGKLPALVAPCSVHVVFS